MPDIITQAETDAIARFLAAGGEITKCPPRYLMPVSGAVPMADGLRTKVRELTFRERKSQESELAKKRKRIAAAASERRTEENARRRQEGLALEKMRKAQVAAERIGKVLRAIGTDWTWERFSEVAKAQGFKAIKSLTGYLRSHGYGDRIPARSYARRESPPKSNSEPKPAADTTERDRGICADYVAGVYVADIAAKWHCAPRTVRGVVADAGIPKRPHVRGVRREKTRRDLAARDAAIRADYDGNIPMEELQAKWNLKQSSIFRAVRRAGGSPGHRFRQSAPRNPTQQDMDIAAAYRAGKSLPVVAREFGVAASTVSLALQRCGEPPRDRSTAQKLITKARAQAARGAA